MLGGSKVMSKFKFFSSAVLHYEPEKWKIAPFSFCTYQFLKMVPSSGHYTTQKNSLAFLVTQKSVKMTHSIIYIIWYMIGYMIWYIIALLFFHIPRSSFAVQGTGRRITILQTKHKKLFDCTHSWASRPPPAPFSLQNH